MTLVGSLAEERNTMRIVQYYALVANLALPSETSPPDFYMGSYGKLPFIGNFLEKYVFLQKIHKKRI